MDISTLKQEEDNVEEYCLYSTSWVHPTKTPFGKPLFEIIVCESLQVLLLEHNTPRDWHEAGAIGILRERIKEWCAEYSVTEDDQSKRSDEVIYEDEEVTPEDSDCS